MRKFSKELMISMLSNTDIKIKLSILFFFLSFLGFAQDKDTGYVVYEMKYHKNQSHLISGKLFFDDTTSFYVYNKIGLDSIQEGNSLQTTKNKGDEIKKISAKISPINEEGTLVFRNFKNKKIILKLPATPLKEPYVIKDNWVKIHWKSLNVHKTILGYDTKKAIGNFRGRNYIVWFAPEIPIPYGPWKLFGLPGLILEAYDTSKDGCCSPTILFKAKEICFPCKTKPDAIYKPTAQGGAISIAEDVFIKDHIMEMNVIKLNRVFHKRHPNGMGFFRNDSPSTPERIKKIRERNMEIQYEWEDYPGDTPNPFGPKLKKMMEKVNSPVNMDSLNALQKRIPKRNRSIDH